MSPASLLAALLALLGVVGLILLARRAALLLPGVNRSPAAGALRLEQTLALDAKRRLLLVRCGRKQLLLLTGGGQDLVVGWLDPATENPEAPP